MKKLLLIAFAGLCVSHCTKPLETVCDTKRQDSTIISLTEQIVSYQDSLIEARTDAFNLDVAITRQYKEIDSLRSRLFLTNYAANKLVFYGNICVRNPSQLVFLKGWQNRAVFGKKFLSMPQLRDSINVFIKKPN